MKRIGAKSRGTIRIIRASALQSGGPSSQFTGTEIGTKYPLPPKTETKARTTGSGLTLTISHELFVMKLIKFKYYKVSF